MDVTYSMASINIGGIRENNRRDLVINYCKILDTDFSIFQETHVNFSHLHNIRKLWHEEIIISPRKNTHTCGVLVIAKRTAPPIEQIITDPGRRYVFFKIKNTTDVDIICTLWNNEGWAHGQTNVDLEDLWTCQNPNGCLIHTFMAGVIITPVLIGLTQVLT